MDVFWENVRTILYALALAMLLRFTIAQPFRIPSGSMQPTLEVGDYIVVTKWSYGYGRYSFAPLEGLLPQGRLFASLPRRGEVVVFRPTPEPDRDFIKRLVGMPGDRIQVIDGLLHINGVAVERESLGIVDFESEDGSIERLQAYRETLPGGQTFTTFDRGVTELDNTREFVVPAGHYFMMGDDRDNSADSRVPGVVGYVPFDNLVGPAQFIVVSFEEGTSIFQPWTLFTGFRGARFLKSVNSDARDEQE
jgi:signal peptidase I